ncbi:MAG: hypothetical protein ACRC8A_02770 [Microcoleaceae cyanobacterium]
MGLFFDVLKSINDPNQQGNVDQLSHVLNGVQQLGAGQGVSASTMQTVMSSLGGFLGPVLKQQGAAGGLGSLDNLVGQFTGANSGGGLPSFITPQLQQQLIQGISQKTGLNASALQTMLPGLLSSVMGLMNMGNRPGTTGANSLLTAFMDGNRDGSTDLGDVFKFASRFINPS